jgi:hypothetical protein
MPDAVAPKDPALKPGSTDSSGSLTGFLLAPPSIAVPRGGGAVRSIGEKFFVNGTTGTSTLSIPLAASAGRSGSGPQPVLRYDSSNGNGPFGFGWRLDVSSIRRTTDRGLPRYDDDLESDTFLLRGGEGLVPLLDGQGRRPAGEATRLGGMDYTVHRYLPRVEGSFLLIERWVHSTATLGRVLSALSADRLSRSRHTIFSVTSSPTRMRRRDARRLRRRPLGV